VMGEAGRGVRIEILPKTGAAPAEERCPKALDQVPLFLQAYKG
jgi:hypothetical protein